MQKHVFLEVWENCLDEEEGGFESFISFYYKERSSLTWSPLAQYNINHKDKKRLQKETQQFPVFERRATNKLLNRSLKM